MSLSPLPSKNTSPLPVYFITNFPKLEPVPCSSAKNVIGSPFILVAESNSPVTGVVKGNPWLLIGEKKLGVTESLVAVDSRNSHVRFSKANIKHQ